MKKINNIYFSIALTFLLNVVYGSDSTALKHPYGISGIYKAGLEILSMDSKSNIFTLRRTKTKFQDVSIPICYDTIAKGSFQFINNGVYQLNNDSNFHKVYFKFNQETRLSEDTCYFEMILPDEDAFVLGRFNYMFRFGCSGSYNSRERIIKIPKSKIFDCENNSLGLVIQDLFPYCNEDQRCSQRIYFRIFDLLSIDRHSNYFTTTLDNFNECYVEKVDVSNEYIFFNGHSIFWRGKEYKKIN
jgi:hypothetical protein